MQKKPLTPKIFITKKGATPPGPTGTQAATLVVLITLLIIFYYPDPEPIFQSQDNTLEKIYYP